MDAKWVAETPQQDMLDMPQQYLLDMLVQFCNE